MKNKLLIVVLFANVLANFPAHAVGTPSNEKKKTGLGLYLDAKEAYEKIKTSKNLLFIDVRTRAEVNFLGMPADADANVPYMILPEFYTWDEKKKNYKLSPNNDFTNEIEKRLKTKGLTKGDEIILMCRSGSRSAKAANLLAKQGYKKVYSVVDGYEGDKSKSGESKGQRTVNGWKNAKLPWTYKLDANKMYSN